eukprot:SAG11_NODE_88_length_17244_cov_17.187460_1_plen_83_part_00
MEHAGKNAARASDSVFHWPKAISRCPVREKEHNQPDVDSARQPYRMPTRISAASRPSAGAPVSAMSISRTTALGENHDSRAL